MQGLLVKILSVGSVCRMRWFVPGCRAVDSPRANPPEVGSHTGNAVERQE